jgi:hypothetical protein
MRFLVMSFAVACFLSFCSGLWASPTVIDIDDNKNSSFTVELFSHVGSTWTYEVTEVRGRDLSHWNLGIVCVLDHIQSYDPTNGEIGTDGSTGFVGIKWEVSTAFSSGFFSFTLDGDYPEGDVPALVKAGNDHNTGMVRGPVCTNMSVVPVPGAVLLGGVGLVCLRWMRGRKCLRV